MRTTIVVLLAASAVANAGCGDDQSLATDRAGIAGPADTTTSNGIGAGCGKPLPAGQPLTVPGTPKGYMHYTVMGTGATLAGPVPAKVGPRTFWVRVPADYDPNRKYRVVYLGQGCGGDQVANTSTYQLFKESMGGTEQAIYVALDIPEDMANQDCYDNRDGPSSQEWEAFELFHTVVDQNYCVDNDNVFVAGYSTGSWLANMWGCYFAGDGQHPWSGIAGGRADTSPRRFAPKYHLRGQSGVNGGEPDNNPPCNGPVAAIWIHDLTDGNAIAGNQAALARVLRLNGCEGSPSAPWHPEVMGTDVCQQYTACPASYPVVFCETNNCHSDDHELAIPAFTLFYDQVSAQP